MPERWSHINHFIVLMLENRSFDHLLGSLAFDTPGIDGLVWGMSNVDSLGGNVGIHPAEKRPVDPSPRHDLLGVMSQLDDKNGGFVKDYESVVGEGDDRRRDVMGYYKPDQLQVLSKLATEFALSDRWFCSVPAETWPNRLFAHAGTSQGHVKTGEPVQLYEMRTIFDALKDAGFHWRVYCEQMPQVAVIRHLGANWLKSFAHLNSDFRSLQQFEEDCRHDRLPEYAFIEPTYVGGAEDDDHAPSDVYRGEELLRRVFLALRYSAAWASSVLVVTFDEHGGFFDHVAPPNDVPQPDEHLGPDGFDFTMLGPRVPTLIISPYVKRGTVMHPKSGKFFDHTSILASLEKRYGLGSLTARDAAADDIWDVLTLDEPRSDDGPLLQTLANWRMPQDSAAERMLVESRLALAAPIGPASGKSGVEIAQTLAALVSGPERFGAVGSLSDLQSDMCELAAALLADNSPDAGQPAPIGEAPVGGNGLPAQPMPG